MMFDRLPDVIQCPSCRQAYEKNEDGQYNGLDCKVVKSQPKETVSLERCRCGVVLYVEINQPSKGVFCYIIGRAER